jgi:hypothetical protein
MFLRAEHAVDPAVQGIMLYMYSPDLPALHAELRSSGAAVPPISYPGGVDPTISPWGYSASAGGSYFTAHFDSANPLDDLFGLFKHLINDVILRRAHGC